jgi:hypothetical protein
MRYVMSKKKAEDKKAPGSFMLRVTGMQVRGPIRMKSFAMTSSIFSPNLNS